LLPSAVRILVVDVEPLVRSGIGVAMAALGYRVDGTASVDEIGQRFADVAFDLVLLDLGSSGIDGLARVRGIPALAETPVIVMQRLRARCRPALAGAPGLLPKPFTSAQLHAAVRSTLLGPLFQLPTLP
jgi:two-component system KDP operon response regulator KdpE